MRTRQDILEEMAAFLLGNANPSIVFHVKNDILKHITEEEKAALQERVMGEKLIYRDAPVLKNAIEAFRTMQSELFGSGDTDCDQYAATGSDIIMAA